MLWINSTRAHRLLSRGGRTGLFFCGNVREIGGMQALDALSAAEGRFLDFYSNYRLKAIKQ